MVASAFMTKEATAILDAFLYSEWRSAQKYLRWAEYAVNEDKTAYSVSIYRFAKHQLEVIEQLMRKSYHVVKIVNRTHDEIAKENEVA